MREGPLNLSPSSTLRKPKTPSRLLYCPSTRRKDILSQMSTMKLVSTSAYFLLLRSTTQAFPKPSIFSQPRFFSSSTTMSAKPFAVVVEAEIQPDRMEEFLAMIETNAINSRKEPGCLRFDVLRTQDAPNKFIFYEVYENPAAVDFHKTQDHYKAWADFKESGGTISSVTKKADGEFVG